MVRVTTPITPDNLISTGQVQVGYYGYGAVATKLAAGSYRWMVA
jgi:hypothetical protein